jgi:hypothetical protein
MAATVLLLLAMAGVLRAQLVTNVTIYQDNFARTGILSGSAPDTVNTPGATWFACNNPANNAVMMTDGSEVACTNFPNPTNGLYLNAFLPFTPQVGHIYTNSVNIVALSGGLQWLAVGFATQAITNNFYAAVNCGAGFTLVRGNGSGIQAYESPGGGNTATVSASFGTTTNLFTVVLDTTTGNANYGWTLRFLTNNVQAASFTIPYNNYPIHYVGISVDGATGYFQQFTLTDVLMRQGVPTISEQPQNTTNQVGQTATFWCGVTNDYPSAAYQWLTNSTGGPTNAIVGATNASYTTPALDMSYNGLNYSVSITNVLGTTNSAPAVLTVVSGPPLVYSATKTASPTQVIVAFSKAVDPVTGLNAGNYSLTINGAPSGVSVLSASYGSASNNVILTTATLNTNTGYYLNVQNVQDLFGNAMSGSTTVPVLPASLVFFVRADSGVVLDNNGLVDQWLDQSTNGNNAAQFFGVPTSGRNGPSSRPGMNTINNGEPSLDFGNNNPIHWLQAPSSPSLASMISNQTMYAVVKFNTTSGNDIVSKNWGNLPAPFDWVPGTGQTVQYGNGFNNAPANGTGGTITANTPLVLASTLTLPLSGPGTTTNFAFYLNGAANGSGAIRGVTGNPGGIYDGGRPLFVGARWDLVNQRMQGQIAEVMLFNANLSGADRTNVDNYLGQKYYTFAITQDLPASTTTSNGFAVTYTFGASQGSVHGFALQWQENGTNIPGATSATYTTPVLGPGDNGETYDVVVTFPNGSTTTSAVNTLMVVSQPPYVTVAGIPIWNTNQVYVLFDEAAVDPATATVAANYSLNNGATVLSAAMGDAANKVILTTSPLTFNANPGFYTLTISNVKDVYGNTMVSASSSLGLYPSTALWVKANTGVTPDGGGGVSGWSDLSGNGNNLNGFGSSTDPVLTNNNSGDTVLRFTGTNDSEMYALSSPTLAITGDMSVFAVMNFANLSGGTNGEILSKTAPPGFNKAAPYDYYMGTAGALLYRGNGTTFGLYTATIVPSTGVPHIIGMTEQGNTVSHFIDGRSAGVGILGGYNESSDTDAGQFLQIGARADNFNRLNGDIAELILASTGNLSSNDIVLLDNYLSLGHMVPLGTAVNTNPTNIVFSASGGNLTLSWPADHTGWRLQTQTNSLAVGLSTNWVTVANSTTTNQVVVPIVPANGSVFYRLIYP